LGLIEWTLRPTILVSLVSSLLTEIPHNPSQFQQVKVEVLRIDLVFFFLFSNGSFDDTKIRKTSELQYHGGTLGPPDSAAAGDGGSGGQGTCAVVIIVVHILFGGGQGVREGAIGKMEVVVGDDADVVHDGVDSGKAVLQGGEYSGSR